MQVVPYADDIVVKHSREKTQEQMKIKPKIVRGKIFKKRKVELREHNFAYVKII